MFLILLFQRQINCFRCYHSKCFGWLIISADDERQERGWRENKKNIRWNNYQFFKTITQFFEHPIFHLCPMRFLFVVRNAFGCMHFEENKNLPCVYICVTLECLRVHVLLEFQLHAHKLWSVVFVIKRSFKRKMIVWKHLLHSENVFIKYVRRSTPTQRTLLLNFITP